MKLKDAIKTDEGVLVTYQRGDGSEFSYMTATPAKYGFPEPVHNPVEGIRKRLEAQQQILAQIEAEPIPAEDEEHVWQVPGPKGTIKEVRANKLKIYKDQLSQAKAKTSALAELLERAIEAFK